MPLGANAIWPKCHLSHKCHLSQMPFGKRYLSHMLLGKCHMTQMPFIPHAKCPSRHMGQMPFGLAAICPKRHLASARVANADSASATSIAPVFYIKFSIKHPKWELVNSHFRFGCESTCTKCKMTTFIHNATYHTTRQPIWHLCSMHAIMIEIQLFKRTRTGLDALNKYTSQPIIFLLAEED